MPAGPGSRCGCGCETEQADVGSYVPHHLTRLDDIRRDSQQWRIDGGHIALEVAQAAFCRHINPCFPEWRGKPPADDYAMGCPLKH
jgi:hypothetical protein